MTEKTSGPKRAAPNRAKTDKPNGQPVIEKPSVNITMERPKGDWKVLGGGDRDQWNKRLGTLVTSALPVNQRTPRPFHAQAPPLSLAL
jgi:hypothetical protein